MYNGQYHAENDYVQLWKNRGLGPLGPSILDPIFVIYAFVSMLPVFSVRDKNFQKVTNWSALLPEISSEQRDLWPFYYT